MSAEIRQTTYTKIPTRILSEIPPRILSQISLGIPPAIFPEAASVVQGFLFMNDSKEFLQNFIHDFFPETYLELFQKLFSDFFRKIFQGFGTFFRRWKLLSDVPEEISRSFRFETAPAFISEIPPRIS